MQAVKVVILQLSNTDKDIAQLNDVYAQELTALRENGFEARVALANETDRALLLEAVADAEVALCAGNPPLDRETMARLPNLKVIVRYGIGLNSIDLQAATEMNKIVFFMAGYCGEELAMHASALILSLLRNIVYYDSRMRQGTFPKGKGPTPRRLSNLTIGLYGLGGSGRAMAKIFGRGFSSKVIACDPFADCDMARREGVDLVSFDTLIEQSDIISIHAPLTPQTHHVFNRDVFRRMKSSAMIVNVSRGPLIDVEALTQALIDGDIAFAGLDVFEIEPLPASCPLLKLDNVALTPHSAYYSSEASQIQKSYSTWFVIEMLKNNTIHRKYVANKDVIDAFPGYRVEE